MGWRPWSTSFWIWAVFHAMTALVRRDKAPEIAFSCSREPSWRPFPSTCVSAQDDGRLGGQLVVVVEPTKERKRDDFPANLQD